LPPYPPPTAVVIPVKDELDPDCGADGPEETLLEPAPPPPTVAVYDPDDKEVVPYTKPPAPPPPLTSYPPPPPPAMTITSAVELKLEGTDKVPEEVNLWYLYPPDTYTVPPVGTAVTVLLTELDEGVPS
jgi:hypothetical protein